MALFAAAAAGTNAGVAAAASVAAEVPSSTGAALSDELLVESSLGSWALAGTAWTSSHMGIAVTWPALAAASSLAVAVWPAPLVPAVLSFLPDLGVPPATAGGAVVAAALPEVALNGAGTVACALFGSLGAAATAGVAVAEAGVAAAGVAAAGFVAAVVAVVPVLAAVVTAMMGAAGAPAFAGGVSTG